RWEDLRLDGTYEHNPYAPEVTPSGINISALRYNLTLTPYERIRRVSGWARLATKLRHGLAQQSQR
ncbi:MAG: hypothetical protein ACR2JY_04790, partial [Chloroflexota bacterium]